MKNKLKLKIVVSMILVIFATCIALSSSLAIINTSRYMPIDVSVWVNVAKQMDEGKIIYRDIFDHKGPIIYFLYYIGYKIDGTLGIWLIHYITVLIDIFVIYNISKRILKDTKKSLLIIGISSVFLALLSGINSETPCTESIALTFILISLYNFMKFNISNNIFSKKESLITGICLGIVLLLRPNTIPLWVVYYLYIFIKCVKEKKIKKLLKIVFFSFLGLFIIAIPVIFYLYINGAINAFWEIYLIFNLKYSSIREANLLETISYFTIKTNYTILIIFLIYVLYLAYIKINKKTKDDTLLVNFIYFILTIIIVIMPRRLYLHYSIIILPSIIYPLILITKNIKINFKIYIFCYTISIIITILLSIFNCLFLKKIKESEYYLNYKDYIQNCTTKEDNILVLGNETYIYIFFDREYKGKYFYQIPIALFDEKIAEEIIAEIKEDEPKLIIKDKNYKFIFEYTKFYYEIEKILDKYYSTEDQMIYKKIDINNK